MINFKSFGQLGISGPTSVLSGNSYNYNGTYNGSQTYSCNSCSWTYNITNGVVTGTSNTSKSGTTPPSGGVIGAASVSVTWNTNPGTLYLTVSSKGNKTITITVVAPLNPGTLSPSSQTINYGTTATTITGTAATGGAVSPVYAYQWMSSPDNVNWTDITGDTSLNYSPGQMYTTTYFKRKVTETTTSTVGYTSSVTVIVYPQIVCSIYPSMQAIASGTAPVGLTSVTTGGNGSYTYQWQSSTNNSSWSNVATTANYSPGTLTSTTYYRLIVTSNSAKDTSNTAIVAINLGLGKGIADLVHIDSIPLAKDSFRITQFNADAYSYSHSIKNVIALRLIEETSKFIPGDFSATVVCKVLYGHTAADTVNDKIDSIKLTVNYTKNQGNKYNSLNYFTFNGAEYTKVTIIRVDAPTTVNGTSFDTKQVLSLTNSLAGTRYYSMPDNKKPTLTIAGASGSPIPDALNVTWTFPANTNNNTTQLEWAWLEDELKSIYTTGSVFDTSLLFKNNSTRIDLPGATTGYSIPLLYGGHGHLYVRVRGANVMPSNSRADGPWSAINNYAFNGHTDSLNWQVTTTYAEEGKRKTVIQYYDGSLRARQTVTKDNSTNTTVVAETMYDAQGRPAIQILPAPGIDSVIAYKKNLNKFNGQADNTNPLDYFDFNTTTLGKYATTQMDTTRGTNYYYSNANASYNKNLPAANGFAYAVTRYTPDATGRVMIQSGVGDSMQMKYSRLTKYYYGTAAQEELDALFGTEVGNYTHYFKNMVQDPNGQMSVSYVDMHGRTIATALAGQSPAPMQALNISDTTQYKNQAGKLMTRNLLDSNSNSLKGNSIESINTILVPYATLYTFNYNLHKQWLTLPKCTGGNIIDTCRFDLQIVISDESDSTVATYNYTGIDTINFQSAVTLPAGSYRIRKTLTINQDSLTKFIQKYDTLNMGICKTQQNLTDSIAALDSTASGCGVTPTPLTSNACFTSLGTRSSYLISYATSLGLADTTQLTSTQKADILNQYSSDSAFCGSLNINTSHTLENIRARMILDMVPDSGQYTNARKGSGSMYNKYSIFSTTGGSTYTQPYYKTPRNEAGSSDYYYTPFGIIDSTVLPTTTLPTLPDSIFERSFDNSWANSLLFYHPEFKRLQYAETNLRSSFNFIDSVNQTVSVAFNAINSDPYFNTVSTADKNTIKKYSDTTWQNGYSMWQLAYGDAFGCKLYMDTASSKTCYGNMPKTFTATNTVVNTGFGNVTLSAAIQLQAWNMYLGLYSSARSDMVNKYIDSHVDTVGDVYHANIRTNDTLISQGFNLYFPFSNAQRAQNSGWTNWYPSSSGVYPTVSLTDSVKSNNTYCDDYINSWRLALVNCPTLVSRFSDSLTREHIVASITSKMDSVCKFGTDGANPYGSSTVIPGSTGIRFTSFEDAVNFVFDSLGIPRSDHYCNPYVIESPKPYSKNPVFTAQYTASVDTCNCSRFTKLKAEITAGGGSISSLTTINSYLRTVYQDTISSVLYNALLQCGQKYVYNARRDSTNICRTVPHTTGGVAVYISLDSAYVATGGTVNFTSTVSNDPHYCNSSYTYQWQSSADGTTWSNISGATGSTYSANFSSSTYIRMNAICQGGSTYPSNSAYVSVSPTCYSYFYRYDTIYSIPLSSPQTLPVYLTCGFSDSNFTCYSCANIKHYDTLFAGIFGRHPLFTGTLNDSDIVYNNLFAQYLNFKTGLQHTWQFYADTLTKTGCQVGGITGTQTALSICISSKPLNDTTGLVPPTPPCQQVRNRSEVKAASLYNAIEQQLIANLDSSYLAKCLAAVESFKVTDTIKEYHYTLYYYDQAGNLVKTIPPKGVNPIYRQTWIDSVENDKKTGVLLVPAHSYYTRYCYNSLNQVNIQKSPDGGVSKFYYDRLGRLTVSQNAKQTGLGKVYSYTNYDSLGRITQVGQITGDSTMIDAIAKDTARLKNWFSRNTTKRAQITQTVYDTAYSPIVGLELNQQNLRNRVSFTQLIDTASDAYPASATYYSYDPHGNVDTLVQDFGNSTGKPNAMNTSGNRFKKIVYDYDLISGKVNQVSYQPGQTDAYYHKYSYDAENRITDVYTGRDSTILLLFPEKEAHYSYYKHGPLMRTVIGQLQVQGLDYAYTLQGWLKGVNPTMGGTLTNGTDTTEAFPVTQDVYGFSLHYYNKDYRAIGWSPSSTTVLGALTTNAAPLYNGNIAAMAVNIPQLSATKLYNYHYDQLNRIAAMDMYNGLNPNSGTFTPASDTSYKERVSYDPNGNILGYLRNGDAGNTMDSLNYKYYANTNQLSQVTDNVSATKYTTDIDNQAANNYSYDAIGNMISDAGDTITNVTWNVYGKILSVTKNGRTIKYIYNASGNRIFKYTNADTTVYVRDATGNVMSVYTKPASGSLAQTEMHLYGSSRLGMATQHVSPDTTVVLVGGFTSGIKSIFTRGEKLFELSNHLGNVLVTVTDRRVQVDANSDGIVDSYKADIASANDYYPFGMIMPARTYSTSSYRYGFNGKEKSDEIEGSGVDYDYGMRIYDSRLGRFLSLDPLMKKYPWFTPYQFAGNTPIRYIDLDGLEPENNPKAPGAKESRAMTEVSLIETKAAKNDAEDNFFSRGSWLSEDDDIKGTYSCGPNGKWVTDTKGDPENKFNMYVNNSATLNVDESQASHFNNYEAFITHRLMTNFVSGKGAENYDFPTNGIISNKFLGSDVLNDALAKYKTGEIKDGQAYQSPFGGKQLINDLLRTGTMFSSITGLVGSATITIKKTNANMLQITIFNVTSLTSGDLWKALWVKKDQSNWPKSYARDPEKTTPFGNISQTFNLLIPNPTK
ncbi:MAG TPA: RHS repeat-associated core domain-containing protein [Puia sp.]|nr:RHS repeat-associated core domain-containing protein [Puia sp.]